jgi:hypothetical protein
VKIAGVDCGCDNRKEIMFTRGNAGPTEAAIIAACVIGVAAAYFIGRKVNAQVG